MALITKFSLKVYKHTKIEFAMAATILYSAEASVFVKENIWKHYICDNHGSRIIKRKISIYNLALILELLTQISSIGCHYFEQYWI